MDPQETLWVGCYISEYLQLLIHSEVYSLSIASIALWPFADSMTLSLKEERCTSCNRMLTTRIPVSPEYDNVLAFAFAVKSM